MLLTRLQKCQATVFFAIIPIAWHQFYSNARGSVLRTFLGTRSVY